MDKVTKQKVVIYVIRDNKLLVFRHLDYSYEEVGIQVPAGGVEKGELSEVAALRELTEETGQSCFKIVTELGMSTYDVTPYRNEIQERYYFLARSTDVLLDRWESSEGGIRFEFFWIPIEKAHVLQSGQGYMIGKAVEFLGR